MVLVIFVSNFTAATAATTHEICTLKQGWRQGRARGSIAPHRNMLAPCRKVKNFFRRFLAVKVPPKQQFSPLVGPFMPPSEISWRHPCFENFSVFTERFIPTSNWAGLKKFPDRGMLFKYILNDLKLTKVILWAEKLFLFDTSPSVIMSSPLLYGL